jgi:hypothetical protein
MLGRAASLLLVFASAACAPSSPVPAPAAAPRAEPPAGAASRPDPAADAAFARLRALVGDWEATTGKGATIRVSYRLVSNEGALVETFTTSSGKETLTIFHLDGPRVVATHYCAQKNQPRLALRSTPDDKRFQFVFLDATNLPDPRASHLVKLGVALVDADHFEKTEIYEEDGKEDVTVFAFRRAPKP